MASADYDHNKASTDLEEWPKRANNPDKQDKITTANQRNSPILRLPGELRIKIYTYVCISTAVKHGEPTDSSYEGCTFTETFLLTCKQFCREAVKLMYSFAKFALTGASGLNSLNPQYRQFITLVQVDVRSVLKTAIPGPGSSLMERLGDNAFAKSLPGVEKIFVCSGLQTELSSELEVFLSKNNVYVTGSRVPITWESRLSWDYQK